ncbi:hypothetical protein [Burkholderia glumae]|uniref:Uncharacterized protein n=1 Tax=Burkholderia glumae TaxID=337 RepID=A0AAP9XXH6_BURGL|nr:hypothetical protein [Burkholderia glumae]MCM2485331.1 hypothetical protein [Burkholderia glumae]MCM2495684.1 hypothetical protein [Burkholderia glumae]MCM2511026.1 hypothetical protein [Burkholderia glumae]MCM2540854.1 hypothetical protein [Burkholderia glumae]MCM2546696.1 hypothetical protein [Burkholderia glumae]
MKKKGATSVAPRRCALIQAVPDDNLVNRAERQYDPIASGCRFIDGIYLRHAYWRVEWHACAYFGRNAWSMESSSGIKQRDLPFVFRNGYRENPETGPRRLAAWKQTANHAAVHQIKNNGPGQLLPNRFRKRLRENLFTRDIFCGRLMAAIGMIAIRGRQSQ